MAFITAYPISNGTGNTFSASIGSTAFWSAIDDLPYNDSDYGSVSSINSYGYVNHTPIGLTGFVSSVLPMVSRCSMTLGTDTMRMGITINGTEYSSTLAVTNSLQTFSKVIKMATGYSIADFDTARFFVKSGTTTRRTYTCSQMYGVPVYTEQAGATTSSDWFMASFDAQDTYADAQPISFKAVFGDLINCTVRDYYHNKPVEGAKIKAMSGTSVFDSALTSSTGWATLGIVGYSDADRFVFEYNQWCFTPLGVIMYSDIAGDTTLSATLGPDTIWPNEASAYAFRKPIYFPAIHSSMPKGTDWTHNFESGNRIFIGENGHANESIQHSGFHILYWKGKTHVVWREVVGKIWGNTYDWARKKWLGPYELVTTRDQSDAEWDSHYYPVISVNPINDYLIIIISGHGTNGITYISSFPNDLSNGVLGERDIGGSVTYPRPLYDSRGSRYTEFRDRNLVQADSYATINLFYNEPPPYTPS